MTFGRALTVLFSHEDWVRVHIKMNLTGDRTRNRIEVKGEWSDHYTTEAPFIVSGSERTDFFVYFCSFACTTYTGNVGSRY